MDKKVIAIIPARSGSKGIKDKNLSDVGGFPLLSYSIAAAKMSKLISRTILSTDSELYADLGKQYGAETPFLRPAELSGDLSTDRDFMIHAMQWLYEHEGEVPEYWVHLRPTTPLRDPVLVDKAIELFMQKSDATALRSAHRCPESPFKWFRKNDNGYFTALTSEETKLDRFNMARQSFPDVYIPDGYVDVVRSSFLLNTDFMHGDKVLCFESPQCVEVDTAEQIDLLNYQINRHHSPLLDYLRRTIR